MKKLVFISGGIFGSLSGLGFLFKVMHWPGAGILLVINVALFSFVFVPSLVKFLYSRNVN